MYIKATKIDRELNEQAQLKYKEFIGQTLNPIERGQIADEEGRTSKWYEDLNIPVPEELKPKNSKPLPSSISFDAVADYDIKRVQVQINLNEVEEFERVIGEEGIEDYTVVIYKSGREITIDEEVNSHDLNSKLN
ncbi:hypothetical protein Phi4:1_gp091 [Cellulophaga phage phi4:1]|uniref:Uncharacterized protein n=5 Tax=Lightbulbvirus TaxID=1918522 RepID=A0A0S2MWN0_9CAUD|nr:hypothetical protein Phi4:1_gp091 [Cellulophaga phage phi4:1]YP_008241588.1 hypothetical protein Phi17:2_gp093 [Cellulophaga phage phi17:2]ALO80100.1 hypothetical protein Phi4113_091 [Cellulophaga phage phi4:1_13]ALO80297.1 hypothetical protein Phi4118_091 [Cellulophaga phage phi4:1_18]ALO80496.1 hypothetical protein Phi17218_093 [Cellulophaga phage phi17:2_18]AGO47626.1 hypothetical protein Phi17:2_gp093 [Cellulophaga phage phi17:2]AGO49504.1 hypothetical protein Phi4:1_gp091 [Cellulophag